MVAPNGSNQPKAESSSVLERLFGTVPRKVGKRSGKQALTIAIASGKGGTGKSFLATSLAVALKDVRRVALVDCDFGLACDHLLLGVKPKRTLQHVVDGGAELSEVCMATPYGPELVPGGSGSRQMANLSASQILTLARGLSDLATEEDVLILDLGAGLAPQSVLTMLAADHVVLVTQREIAALTDAYAVTKCLVQLHEEPQISVVVNRVPERGQGQATYEKLAEVAQRFTGVQMHYLGEIGEDPSVTQCRLGQPPLVVSNPQCRTAKAIRVILSQLVEAAGPLRPRKREAEDSLEARFHKHMKNLH
ncbi:MAG: nucleotide-binding protein [Planctomycetota bacterium]